MLVWILGCGGLLGRTLQLFLKNKKIRTLATTHHMADITNLNQLRDVAKKERPTHLINCSAYNKVDQAEKEVELAFQVNAMGPENLGILGRECGIRVVHVSTDYVFDGKKIGPYLETDPCNPLNVYGKSKREGEERLLQTFREACIVRTSWLYGKGGINFISGLPDLLKKKKELSVDAKQISCPTFCFDLAEALFDLLPYSGIFHFANRGPTTRLDVSLEMLKLSPNATCRTINPLINPIFVAERPLYSVLDVGKAEKILGRQIRPWTLTLKEFLQDA